MVCPTAEEAGKVLSQLKIIIRAAYSNPPIHGAHIVRTILSDAELEKQWYSECKGMADRIIEMRQLLVDNLAAAGSTKDWSHITSQVILPTAPGVSNEGPRSRVLVPLPAVSWPWVPAWGSLEPPRQDGENAQKNGKKRGKNGRDTV